MNASASARRSAVAPYFEGEVGGVLASDAAFFMRHPTRAYRIREATPAEIRIVQEVERRLLDPNCKAIVMIHRTDTGRRRVVVEGCGFDFDIETMSDAEIRLVFDQVVAGGWTVIEWRGHEPDTLRLLPTINEG
jgi:hypothetical protein